MSIDVSVAASLRTSRRSGVSGSLLRGATLACLTAILLVLVVLMADIATAALRVFAERGTDVLNAPLSSLPERAGVRQGIVGSLLLVVIVAVVALPLGIAAAIYLEEYARDSRMTRLVQVNVRNLAGVPSIVYGLLGLAVFVTALRGVTGGASTLTGGLTLAILVLPIVVITTSEALGAVPRSLREASYGLGATRWQTVRSQVLPAAAPGILTGTVLSLSRALGETAPLLLVGSVTGFLATAGGGLGDQLRGPFTALPTIIFSWARQPNADFRDLTAAAIVVLLAVIVVANSLAILLRDRFDRRW